MKAVMVMAKIVICNLICVHPNQAHTYDIYIYNMCVCVCVCVCVCISQSLDGFQA